ASAGPNCSLTWQNIRVRPTAGAPLISGAISKSGTASMTNISSASNFGGLREVAGAANKLSVQSQPSTTATAGVVFARQPVVRVEDRFGNLRSAGNGTPDNSTAVTAARSGGSGLLQGTLTARAVDGLASFTNLLHNVATNITINFTSASLSNALSSSILVSPTAATQLAFTTQPANGTDGA